MGRPRKHNKGLPKYVRIRNGSYLYRDKKLCRVDDGEARMYEELAKRKENGDLTMIPEAVGAFKLEYLPTLAPSSRAEHKRLLDIFADEFSEFRVQDVKPNHIKKSVRNLYLKDGKEVAGHHYKSRIATFFQWCVDEEGLIEANPAKEVRLNKNASKRTPWTVELFWKMRDHLKPMYQCYHDLSFLLYQRTTDVRMLRHSQIKNGMIHFEPSKTLKKAGTAVDIPVTPAIQEVIDRAVSLCKVRPLPGGDAYVIQTRQGASFTRSGIYSAYRRADAAIHGKDKNGKPIVTGLNPKALRPFAATLAKQQGFSKEQLQTGLAHRSVKTTEGYIQSHEVPVSEVALRLPERP